MKRAVTYETTTHTVWFAGNLGAVVAAMKTVDTKCQWNNARKSWGVPCAAAGDVLAALQAAGVPTVEQLG